MVGIKSYGVYLPYYRLNRAEIGQYWGGFQAMCLRKGSYSLR